MGEQDGGARWGSKTGEQDGGAKCWSFLHLILRVCIYTASSASSCNAQYNECLKKVSCVCGTVYLMCVYFMCIADQ